MEKCTNNPSLNCNSNKGVKRQTDIKNEKAKREAVIITRSQIHKLLNRFIHSGSIVKK